MKIYLTEITVNGETFPGPSIMALDIIAATLVAKEIKDGLVVVGELTNLFDMEGYFESVDNEVTIH